MYTCVYTYALLLVLWHLFFHLVAILAQAPNGQVRPAWPMAPKRSLLEAAFQGESATKRPRRSLGAATVAQQVAKALHDNFKNFTEAQIDSAIVDGVSLRARLTRDKAQNAEKPGSVTMGRIYYNKLKMLYAGENHPTKLLIIKDASAQVRPELFQAMLASKRTPPQRQPMLQLLQNMSEQPNQSEVVGILRWMASLTPSLSSEQYQGVIQTMRWLTRLGLDKEFKAEVEVCKSYFEEGLLLALSIKHLTHLLLRHVRLHIIYIIASGMQVKCGLVQGYA
jgi:hypothetical protein